MWKLSYCIGNHQLLFKVIVRGVLVSLSIVCIASTCISAAIIQSYSATWLIFNNLLASKTLSITPRVHEIEHGYHLSEYGGGLLYVLLVESLHDKAGRCGHHVTKGGVIVGGA